MRKLNILLFVTLFVFLNGCSLFRFKKIPFHTSTIKKSLIGEKICIVGDTGTGGIEQYRVIEEMRKRKCSQIRIVGDVVYENGILNDQDPDYLTKFYKPFRKIFEVDDTPIFLTMGNHDHRASIDSWIDIAKKNKYINYPNYYYIEKWDNICIISIDTEIDFGHGQGDFLKKELNNLQSDCEASVVLGHSPYKSSGAHGDASGSLKKFLEIIVGKVDIFVAGHDHNLAYEGEVKGTHQYVSGSGGKLRKIKRSGAPFIESKFGFLELEFIKKRRGLYRYLKLYRIQ